MVELLVEFINTLDISLKNSLKTAGDGTGYARLTVHQLQYIEAAARLGEPALSELADALGITRASVTAAVNRLVAMGYLKKARSNMDRRVFHVYLTPAAEQLVTARSQALQAYSTFIRTALDENEARQFEDTLAKLVQIFKHGE